MTNIELFKMRESVAKVLRQLDLEIELRNLDWRHLAEADMVASAVKSYRNQHGGSLTNAVKVVRAFRSS